MLNSFGFYLREAGSLFHWLTSPAAALALVIYIARLPSDQRSAAADQLFDVTSAKSTRSGKIAAATTGAFFLALFAILLWKNLSYLKTQFEIRWHIAFLNYDLDWHTPIFSLAGNVLYQFEIQPPFNTSLAPLNGIAHLVSPDLRIVTVFTLFYLAMSALLWAVGRAVGLTPVARALCAGLTALITTIPYGLDHVFPFLPPPFVFVSESMATSFYEELGVLCLTTVILFFWIGQCRTIAANAAIGVAFSAASYLVLLAYPGFAFFATPVIISYCCAFLLTPTGKREFRWKLGVSAALLATMLAARIPVFFKNLYAYTYGAYFSDQIMNADSQLTIWKYATVLGVFWPDPKVLLLCLVSCASAIFFIIRGNLAVRRFAIAMLAGEAAAFTVGAIVAYLHIPVSLYYADQLQAPISVFFFTLPLAFAVIVLAGRIDAAFGKFLDRLNSEGKVAPALGNRRTYYAVAFLVLLAASPFLIPRERPFDNSAYPPGQPPSVQLLQHDLELKPGKAFAGRVFTLVQQGLPAAVTAGSSMNPLLTAVLDVLENRYGRYTGNDHWNDLLNLNISVFGEYGQWTTPINFVLLHEFFARKEDVFQKSAFILRAYNERVARMMGVRYVVTDAPNIPGGTLAYDQMAGDTPLRIFRLDDVNVGQYSPTRTTRISTAIEGIAAIKRNSFDPEQEALVEQDAPPNLVPGTLTSLTVETGPVLHVRAQSPGTSLLVLPFEYSHCLRLNAVDGAPARLIPVNLQQTGLIFEGHIEADINFDFGPLSQLSCRGEDLARMDRLHVHDALN
jgi:hypothetical protein